MSRKFLCVDNNLLLTMNLILDLETKNRVVNHFKSIKIHYYS